MSKPIERTFRISHWKVEFRLHIRPFEACCSMVKTVNPHCKTLAQLLLKKGILFRRLNKYNEKTSNSIFYFGIFNITSHD